MSCFPPHPQSSCTVASNLWLYNIRGFCPSRSSIFVPECSCLPLLPFIECGFSSGSFYLPPFISTKNSQFPPVHVSSPPLPPLVVRDLEFLTHLRNLPPPYEFCRFLTYKFALNKSVYTLTRPVRLFPSSSNMICVAPVLSPSKNFLGGPVILAKHGRFPSLNVSIVFNSRPCRLIPHRYSFPQLYVWCEEFLWRPSLPFDCPIFRPLKPCWLSQ